MAERLTVTDKLLLAALKLRETSKTFSAEDLVVYAWKMFPDTFGLAGYSAEYPDSNRILTKIMGTQGMRGKGWLRKVGEKQYRLTAKALDDGEGLLDKNRGGDSAGQNYLRAQLHRETASQLSRLVTTAAARKALEMRDDEVTFNEACGFWDISARSNANTLNARLGEVSSLLRRAKEAITSGAELEGVALQSRRLTQEEIDIIARLHADLQSRFSGELKIIKSRKDERVRRMRRMI